MSPLAKDLERLQRMISTTSILSVTQQTQAADAEVNGCVGASDVLQVL